ncbi:MAG: exodeoxyribonuclease VII small subunit [Bdellovibrionota bacterium]
MAEVQESGVVNDKISFEVAVEKLQSTVKKLESGNLSLEDALKHFEEGVRLSRICQTQIAAAEQKVEILMKAGADASSSELQPFSPSPRS